MAVKHIFFILTGVLLVCAASGCKPCRVAGNFVTDSTVVTETPRADTFYLPGDTTLLEVMIECDSATNKPKPAKGSAKGQRSGVIYRVDSSGLLAVTAYADSLQEVIEAKDRLIDRYRKEKQVIVQPEYRTRWYDIASRWIAAAALVYFAIKLKFK